MIFLVAIGTYVIAVLVLWYGWELSIHKTIATNPEPQFISVIIPVRNEEANLATLLDSLSRLDYPKDKFEVIIIDDNSSDNTQQILKQRKTDQIKVQALPSPQEGKKRAITFGISNAKGEIIVTTDADCKFNSRWLQTINSIFDTTDTQLVIGPVSIDTNGTFFSFMQAVEFSSLIGSGAALLKFGLPVMANGANLAFRKNAFDSVSGYEGNFQVASGDDEYLLRKIFKRYPNGISFNNDSNSVVQTSAQKSISDFFQQRLRWASKWKFNNELRSKMIGLVVFLYQVAFIALIVSLVLFPTDLLKYLLLVKIFVDALFLFRTCSFLGCRFRLLPFLLLEILYPFYAFLIALLSIFVPYQWKNRRFTSS